MKGTVRCGILVLLLALGPTNAQNLQSELKEGPRIGGSISAGMTINSISDTTLARKRPFSWTISAAPTLSIYGIDLPFSFTIGEQERSFRQSFDQFGLSPQYKWATVNLGYRNISYSPYTLAGHTILGVGAEINPGILRLGAVYGQFQRAVPESATRQQDTLDRTPAFRRTGYSVKLGVGTDRNNLDLIVLRASDDMKSIPPLSETSGVMPAENAVIGLSSRQSLFRVLTWDMDAGISHYTRDLRADTVHVTIPFMSSLGNWLRARSSTKVCIGGQTGLGMTLGGLSIRAQYRYVEPDYQSMGADYVSSDISALSVTPSLSLLQNRVTLTGGVTQQSDNLMGKKLATTQRLTWNGGISLNPAPQFGIDLQYSSLGTTQTPGRLPLNDSTRLDQVTQTFSITPRVTLSSAQAVHTLAVNFNATELKDNNPFTATQSKSNSQLFSASYQLTLPASNWTFAPSFNTSRVAGAASLISTSGPSLTVAKPLLKNALSLSLTPALAWSLAHDTTSSSTFTVNASAGYRPFSRHSFNLGLSYVANTTQVGPAKSFTEFTASLNYALSF